MSETVDWTDPEQVKAAARKAYSDENGGASNRTEARDVFAVDRKAAFDACDLGLGVAVSYLVLACHTRGSTGITKASANAIENLVGINHHRAARHIDELQSAGLMERIDGNPGPRSRPVYRLRLPAKPELVWLPNELVRGSQMTPLKLLWHGQDETVLRCLIELYFCNHLPTDGGVSRSVLRLPFERHEVARFGEYAVWGFRQTERRALGDTALVEAFDVFCDSGLSTQVPHLCLSDHPEADVIHPYGTKPTSSLEDRIGHAAHQAGLALISAEQRRWVEAEGLWLAPVSLSIPRVAMVGVARLQHQPETQTTLDWQRKLVEITPGIIAGYDRLVASAGHRLTGIG